MLDSNTKEQVIDWLVNQLYLGFVVDEDEAADIARNGIQFKGLTHMTDAELMDEFETQLEYFDYILDGEAKSQEPVIKLYEQAKLDMAVNKALEE